MRLNISCYFRIWICFWVFKIWLIFKYNSKSRILILMNFLF